MPESFQDARSFPVSAAKLCAEEATGLTGTSSKVTFGCCAATFSVLCGLGAFALGEGVTGVAGGLPLLATAAALALGSAGGVLFAAALGGAATAALL